MSQENTEKIPPKPDRSTDLKNTKKYLLHLAHTKTSVELRELIGYWGYKARGSRVVNTVNEDLAEMSLTVFPPIDSGPLDMSVYVSEVKASETAQYAFDQTDDDHLLRISRIESSTYAFQNKSDGDESQHPILYSFTKETTVSQATALMTRYDYSQVPVVVDEAGMHPIGAFTWESFSRAVLRGENPQTVGDALVHTHNADLNSDLFSCIELVATHGFILTTHQGRLTGIVTPTDLINELSELTQPFLAIGRCERELRRVAGGSLKTQLAASKTPIEEMSFGSIQHFYKNNWEALKWVLDKATFINWLDDTRKLRNRIAHFETQDSDYADDVESVNRLTSWLSTIQFEKES